MDSKTQSILLSLFDYSQHIREGLLDPVEYTEVAERQEEAKQALQAALTPEQWALFEQFYFPLRQESYMQAQSAFQVGLATGIRLMQFALS